MFNKRLNINQILLPQRCLLCAASDGKDIGICEECHQDLPWHLNQSCPQCALPSHDGRPCGNCLKSPPAFDQTLALFQYRFPLDAMLQRYKYQHMLNLSRLFGLLFIQHAKPDPIPDVLIPMPLHADRLRDRGYNQSLEIARSISRFFAIPMDMQGCQRIRATPPQTSLPLKQRVGNMKNAFDCRRDLQGLRIALVDDVMTTGASMHSLARTVKEAGAMHVQCWVIARTLPR